MREFADDELDPVVAANAGTACQARQMLAVITYCYAVGTYRSQDIEATMREDVLFRLACGNEFPGWRMIRRFRRLNREAIRLLLEETFRRAWGINGCASPRFTPGSGDCREWRNSRNNGHSDVDDFIAAEAHWRIEEACRIDMMDDEDD
ncbi:MAG TPA: transposase [Methylomirabilota bacterium]|nr:transposase [Methylomirabilota bacterium]